MNFTQEATETGSLSMNSEVPNLLDAQDVSFSRDEDGRMLMHTTEAAGGLRIAHVTSAFPLTKPGKWICIRNEEGEEIGILKTTKHLDSTSRSILEDELERCYFMPKIMDILNVEEAFNLVNMDIVTNRGARTIQIKDVQNSLRKMPKGRIIIRDLDGNRYEISDWHQLNPSAQDILALYL